MDEKEVNSKENYKLGISIASIGLTLFLLLSWLVDEAIKSLIDRVLDPLGEVGAVFFYFVLPSFSYFIYLGLSRIIVKTDFKDNSRDATKTAIITYLIFYSIMFFLLLGAYDELIH